MCRLCGHDWPTPQRHPVSNDHLTPEQRTWREIRIVLSSMRYGAAMGVPHPSQVDNLATLLAWLKAFSPVLGQATDEASARDAELRQLRGDLASAGRLLRVMVPVDGAR